MKRHLTILIILMGLALPAIAKDSGGCRTIHHKEGRVYVIKAALYHGTHIRLPEKLLIEPIPGDADLWTVAGDGHHIMIQPNSAEAQGKRTTLTLIDKNNVSYNFKLIRVSAKEKFDICVTIKNKDKFFNHNKLSSSSYQTPDDINQKRLQDQIRLLQAGLSREKKRSEQKIDDVLKKYRSFIYTRYQWKDGKGFKGKGLVTDVYDDGRFTFIRMVPDNRGMMTVTAKIDGNKEMIEYVAESDTVYRISGIYPEFSLRHGKSDVNIKRRDNLSNGVY